MHEDSEWCFKAACLDLRSTKKREEQSRARDKLNAVIRRDGHVDVTAIACELPTESDSRCGAFVHRLAMPSCCVALDRVKRETYGCGT